MVRLELDHFILAGIVGAIIVAAYSFVLNQVSIFPFYSVGPYAFDVVIWGVGYLIAYRKWKSWTPHYFLFLWGWQELTWNFLFFTHHGWLGINFVISGGNAIGLGTIAMVTFWLGFVPLTGGFSKKGKNRLKIRYKWFVPFLAIAVVYWFAGTPVAYDWLTKTEVDWHWMLEALYNIPALALYYKMFDYNAGLKYLDQKETINTVPTNPKVV
jgi:hypothetical protein